MVEMKKIKWENKEGTKHWKAVPKEDGDAIGGHWIQPKNSPGIAHIDKYKNKQKEGKL